MEVEATVGRDIVGLCEWDQLFNNIFVFSSVPEVVDLLPERGVLVPVVTDGVGVMELVRDRFPCGFTSEIEELLGLTVRTSLAASFKPVSYLLANMISVSSQQTKYIATHLSSALLCESLQLRRILHQRPLGL